MKWSKYGLPLASVLLFFGCAIDGDRMSPVDYVNPYMGNISHLLVPTYPTVHLPNSMLRVYPEREDFTAVQLNGLPLIVTSHRGKSAFNLSPVNGKGKSKFNPVYALEYDNEVIKPYLYTTTLEEGEVAVRYAPSHQSAIYELTFADTLQPVLVINARAGAIEVKQNTLRASQQLNEETTVYLYAELDVAPAFSGLILPDGRLDTTKKDGRGDQVAAVLGFETGQRQVHLRYGISFIDHEQAQRNLQREITTYNLDATADAGKAIWNEELGKIKVTGQSAEDKAVFYTSLYRCLERPVNISEDGRYFSAFDGQVHTDSVPFYTDDWLWDSYRAAHPLRVLIDGERQTDIIQSFIKMAEQMDNFWFPTFPEITGDSRRMNSNHGVAVIADAYNKGLRGFDLEKAYVSAEGAISDKTLAPWSASPAGWLDDFYKQHGYIPALPAGEAEQVPEVNHFEKRQPVAVTLGTAFDQWCLGLLADALGKPEAAEEHRQAALSYRNLFNRETGFFHPKDQYGQFIEPFDYRYSGGQGAREYYGENNGWIYRWDVPHHVADLIELMGGKARFVENLDWMFSEPLGRSKFDFYSQLPDHTGNVGQFSMANEPSLHIPYLYAYAGQPWKTQKRVHDLIHQWFRNDLMGVPGDEDGGGLSSFVVFSMLGFYPVTPGMPVYVIGTPFFEEATIQLTGGGQFTVHAEGVSKLNKYIQSARLNGKPWDKPWFAHTDIENGGTLELEMGPLPNKAWGAAEPPPSFTFEKMLNQEAE